MSRINPDAPPRPAAAPGGAGPPGDEKMAAGGFMIGGFLLGGPVGLVVAALAVGIERAFLKSGWEQPGWAGGERAPRLTPEELTARRQEAARMAKEFLDDLRARDAARKAAHDAHKQAMKDYVNNGRQGDKPVWDGSRNPQEFINDLWGASKAWYKLFDDKLATGNEKVNDFYGKAGNFFKNLWGFLTGFVEGYNEERNAQKAKQKLDEERQQADYEWGRPFTEKPAKQPTGDRPAPAIPAIPMPGPQQPGLDPAGPAPAGQQPTPTPDPAPAAPVGPQTAVPAVTGPRGSTSIQGDVMDHDGSVALPATGGGAPAPAPQRGTTNLELLYESFRPAAPLLVSVGAQAAELAMEHRAIVSRLQYIAALCAVHGAPTVVNQVLAEGWQTANAMANGIVLVDKHNAIARELTEEALIGLAPAQQDLDAIRSQGASGDLLGEVQD